VSVAELMDQLPLLSFQPEVEEALSLALRAGEVALRYYTPDMQVDYKGEGDPVTKADRAINTLLVNALHERFPEDGILAEESADEPEKRVSRRRLWCIDPLDGTREFTERIDQWAIMIGLAVAGMATVGVVYPPSLRYVLVGVVSEGAWMWRDGRWHALQVSDVHDPRQATIAVSRSHRSPLLDAIIEKMGIRREIRHGSVGMKVGLLATQKADLYIHPTRGTKEWDLCAPEAILRAAGGQMTDVWGCPLQYNKPNPDNPLGLIASNGLLHAAAVEATKAVLSATAESQ